MIAMKKILLFLFLLVFGVRVVNAQTTVFSDNFEGTTSGLPSTAGSPATFTTGSSPSMTYTVASNGTNPTVSVTTVTSKVLTINNGATTPVKSANWVTGPLSSFSAPFNTTLSSNPGLVTWSFNVSANNNSTGAFGYRWFLCTSGCFGS